MHGTEDIRVGVMVLVEILNNGYGCNVNDITFLCILDQCNW